MCESCNGLLDWQSAQLITIMEIPRLLSPKSSREFRIVVSCTNKCFRIHAICYINLAGSWNLGVKTAISHPDRNLNQPIFAWMKIFAMFLKKWPR